MVILVVANASSTDAVTIAVPVTAWAQRTAVKTPWAVVVPLTAPTKVVPGLLWNWPRVEVMVTVAPVTNCPFVSNTFA
jgi:hypothetical protein